MLHDPLLRRLGAALHARAAGSSQIRPEDDPRLITGADVRLRVLLVGTGVTTGWGVHTHGLALAGWLQHALQSRLEVAVDVEQVSGHGVRIADAPGLLGDRADERWDLVVVAFGLSDAFLLTATREWAAGLDRLLHRLRRRRTIGAVPALGLVGIPPMDSVRAAGPFGGLLQRHAQRLNALSRTAVAGDRRAAFVDLPPLSGQGSLDGSSDDYRRWAERIADSTTALLDPPRPPQDGPSGRLPDAVPA